MMSIVMIVKWGFTRGTNDRASVYTLPLSGEYLRFGVEDERPNSGPLGNPNTSSRDAASDSTRSVREKRRARGVRCRRWSPVAAPSYQTRSARRSVCPARLARY